MRTRAKGAFRHVFAGLACAACLQTNGQALNLAVSNRDIERAQKIASETESARARFHGLYIQPVNDATVEQIEIITEFRRCVLVTEERLRLGDWMFGRGVRAVSEVLRPYRGRVSVVARLRFHPQNTFGDIPPSECAIGAASAAQPAVSPLDVIRTRIDQLQTGGQPGRSAPLLGALIETVFDAASIGETMRPVRVLMNGQTIARVSIDFSRLE